MEVHLSSDKNFYIIKDKSLGKFLCCKEVFDKIQPNNSMMVADLILNLQEAKELHRQLGQQLLHYPFKS
jgi:hypothetical protein